MDNHWISVDELPECSEKWGDSDYYLCYHEYEPPFVAWYNDRSNQWTVAHHSSSDIPVIVEFYQPLPQPPEKAHSQAEKDSWDMVN